MEWQGVITGQDDRALGARALVSATLMGLFPGLSFKWSPSGADQLAALDARGVELPDLVRQVLAAKPSTYGGSTQAGPISLSLNLGSGDPVMRIWATVGGERERAEAALAQLQSQEGWVLVSPEPLSVLAVAPGEPLHLSGDATLVSRASPSAGSPKK